MGISPLIHKGLQTFVLATVRDLTHNKYTDSIIGGLVAPLSDGPVYFDCFPNFSVYTFDETIKDILQLQIHTMGFDMKGKRNNIAIQTKACFRHTNTLWPAIRHTPSRDSKSSVVVKTDPKNQKIEHLLIKWEELQFPENWVVNHSRPLIPRNITSTNITEDPSKAVISFPRRSTIDRRRIDAACKSSKYYRDPATVDTACSSSLFSSCRHN